MVVPHKTRIANNIGAENCGKFSLNVLYDRASAARRLFGIRHDGLWYHVGTPEHLARAEADLAPVRATR